MSVETSEVKDDAEDIALGVVEMLHPRPDRFNDDAAKAEFLRIMSEKLGWDEAEKTNGSAAKWWNAFMRENTHRPKLIFRLCEELAARGRSITEFFYAYVYSNTDNIQANLYYLDYTTLKKREEAEKRQKKIETEEKGSREVPIAQGSSAGAQRVEETQETNP